MFLYKNRSLVLYIEKHNPTMYTEQYVKEWITERLPRGVKSLTISIRNSKPIQEALLLYTKEHENLSFSARANLIYAGNRPACTVCGSYTYFNRNRWEFGETCSVKCAANNKRRNEQIKSTLIEKYGVDNIFKSKVFKENLKEHNLNKYGTEYYFQSKDCEEKKKMIFQERYGVNSYTQAAEFQEKRKKTVIEKYGVENYSQTPEFQEKFKKASLEKYGVDHPMKSLEVFEKQQKNSYYYKDYILPSMEVARVQGYENKALDELLLTYREEDILISNRDIFAKFGAFEYEYEGKTHRYFPDIFLIPECLFIEVKSTRTFSVNKKKNLLKRESVLAKELRFEFWIYGKEGKTVG